MIKEFVFGFKKGAIEVYKKFKEVEFNILSPYDEEMLKNNASLMKRRGFKVLDLRESAIEDKDGNITGRVYVLLCKGSEYDYEKFKKDFACGEIMYEGRKTLM